MIAHAGTYLNHGIMKAEKPTTHWTVYRIKAIIPTHECAVMTSSLSARQYKNQHSMEPAGCRLKKSCAGRARASSTYSVGSTLTGSIVWGAASIETVPFACKANVRLQFGRPGVMASKEYGFSSRQRCACRCDSSRQHLPQDRHRRGMMNWKGGKRRRRRRKKHKPS